jgi:ABC-type enterobactin transport system permease subunit
MMKKLLDAALLGVAAVVASDLAVTHLPASLDFGSLPVRKYGAAVGGVYLVHALIK